MKRFIVNAMLDATGCPEEFTWDLFPVVEADRTTHLDTNGLPKVGTQIASGMVVVGKIGRTSKYRADIGPTALEIEGLPQHVLKERYGHMWADGSLYATDEMCGTVVGAVLVGTGADAQAIVDISPLT